MFRHQLLLIEILENLSLLFPGELKFSALVPDFCGPSMQCGRGRNRKEGIEEILSSEATSARAAQRAVEIAGDLSILLKQENQALAPLASAMMATEDDCLFQSVSRNIRCVLIGHEVMLLLAESAERLEVKQVATSLHRKLGDPKSHRRRVTESMRVLRAAALTETDKQGHASHWKHGLSSLGREMLTNIKAARQALS